MAPSCTLTHSVSHRYCNFKTMEGDTFFLPSWLLCLIVGGTLSGKKKERKKGAQAFLKNDKFWTCFNLPGTEIAYLGKLISLINTAADCRNGINGTILYAWSYHWHIAAFKQWKIIEPKTNCMLTLSTNERKWQQPWFQLFTDQVSSKIKTELVTHCLLQCLQYCPCCSTPVNDITYCVLIN